MHNISVYAIRNNMFSKLHAHYRNYDDSSVKRTQIINGRQTHNNSHMKETETIFMFTML